MVAIAAGGHHSPALRSDESVLAWGHNSTGQLGNAGEKDVNQSVPVPVIGLDAGGGVVAVAAGYQHSPALRSDGTVLAWPATPALLTVAAYAACPITAGVGCGVAAGLSVGGAFMTGMVVGKACSNDFTSSDCAWAAADMPLTIAGAKIAGDFAHNGKHVFIDVRWRSKSRWGIATGFDRDAIRVATDFEYIGIAC